MSEICWIIKKPEMDKKVNKKKKHCSDFFMNQNYLYDFFFPEHQEAPPIYSTLLEINEYLFL